jgi:hypothetical protein
MNRASPPDGPLWADDCEQVHVAAGHEQTTSYVIPSLHVSADSTSHEPTSPCTPDVPSEHVTPGPGRPASCCATAESDDDDASSDEGPSSPLPALSGGPSLPATRPSSRSSPVREPHPTRTASAAARERIPFIGVACRWRTYYLCPVVHVTSGRWLFSSRVGGMTHAQRRTAARGRSQGRSPVTGVSRRIRTAHFSPCSDRR